MYEKTYYEAVLGYFFTSDNFETILELRRALDFLKPWGAEFENMANYAGYFDLDEQEEVENIMFELLGYI